MSQYWCRNKLKSWSTQTLECSLIPKNDFFARKEETVFLWILYKSPLLDEAFIFPCTSHISITSHYILKSTLLRYPHFIGKFYLAIKIIENPNHSFQYCEGTQEVLQQIFIIIFAKIGEQSELNYTNIRRYEWSFFCTSPSFIVYS